MPDNFTDNEPVVIILDDVHHAHHEEYGPDQVGNVIGMFYFLVVFMAICIVVSVIGTFRRK